MPENQNVSGKDLYSMAFGDEIETPNYEEFDAYFSEFLSEEDLQQPTQPEQPMQEEFPQQGVEPDADIAQEQPVEQPDEFAMQGMVEEESLPKWSRMSEAEVRHDKIRKAVEYSRDYDAMVESKRVKPTDKLSRDELTDKLQDELTKNQQSGGRSRGRQMEIVDELRSRTAAKWLGGTIYDKLSPDESAQSFLSQERERQEIDHQKKKEVFDKRRDERQQKDLKYFYQQVGKHGASKDSMKRALKRMPIVPMNISQAVIAAGGTHGYEGAYGVAATHGVQNHPEMKKILEVSQTSGSSEEDMNEALIDYLTHPPGEEFFYPTKVAANAIIPGMGDSMAKYDRGFKRAIAGGVAMAEMRFAKLVSRVGGIVSDKPYTKMVELVGQYNNALDEAAQREFGEDSWGAYLDKRGRGTVSSATEMVAAGFILGPPAAIAYATVQTADDAEVEAEKAGLTGDDKWRFVGQQAFAEGAITAAFQMGGLGGAESLFAGGGKEALKGSMKEVAKQLPLHLVKVFVPEAIEELGIMFSQQASKKFEGVDKNALDIPTLIKMSGDILVEVGMMIGGGTVTNTAANAAVTAEANKFAETTRKNVQKFVDSPTRRTARDLPAAINGVAEAAGVDMSRQSERKRMAIAIEKGGDDIGAVFGYAQHDYERTVDTWGYILGKEAGAGADADSVRGMAVRAQEDAVVEALDKDIEVSEDVLQEVPDVVAWHNDDSLIKFDYREAALSDETAKLKKTLDGLSFVVYDKDSKTDEASVVTIEERAEDAGITEDQRLENKGRIDTEAKASTVDESVQEVVTEGDQDQGPEVSGILEGGVREGVPDTSTPIAAETADQQAPALEATVDPELGQDPILDQPSTAPIESNSTPTTEAVPKSKPTIQHTPRQKEVADAVAPALESKGQDLGDDVIVVDTVEESNKYRIEGTKTRKGVRGFYSSGLDKVVLIGDNLRGKDGKVDTAQAIETTLHEIVHKGVNKIDGMRAEIRSVAADMSTEMRSHLTDIAKRRGLDLDTESGRERAIHEYIAEMGSKTRANGLIDRLVKGTKKVLVKLGIQNATDAYCRDILNRAGKALEADAAAKKDVNSVVESNTKKQLQSTIDKMSAQDIDANASDIDAKIQKLEDEGLGVFEDREFEKKPKSKKEILKRKKKRLEKKRLTKIKQQQEHEIAQRKKQERRLSPEKVQAEEAAGIREVDKKVVVSSQRKLNKIVLQAQVKAGKKGYALGSKVGKRAGVLLERIKQREAAQVKVDKARTKADTAKGHQAVLQEYAKHEGQFDAEYRLQKDKVIAAVKTKGQVNKAFVKIDKLKDAAIARKLRAKETRAQTKQRWKDALVEKKEQVKFNKDTVKAYVAEVGLDPSLRHHVNSIIERVSTPGQMVKAMAKIDILQARKEHKNAVQEAQKTIKKVKRKYGKEFTDADRVYGEKFNDLLGSLDENKLSQKRQEEAAKIAELVEADPTLKQRLGARNKNLLERAGKEYLVDMDTEEILSLNETLKVISKRLERKREFKLGGDKHLVSDVAGQISDVAVENDSKGRSHVTDTSTEGLETKRMSWTKQYILWKKADFELLAEIADTMKEGGPVTKFVFGQLNDANGNKKLAEIEVHRKLKAIEEKYGIDAKMLEAWGGVNNENKTAIVGVDLPSGKKLVMDRMTRVALALTIKRDLGRQALLRSSFVYEKPVRKRSLKRAGKMGVDRVHTEVRFGKIVQGEAKFDSAEQDIKAFMDSLTAGEKSMMRLWRDISDGDLAARINRTSNIVEDRDIATEDNYFAMSRVNNKGEIVLGDTHQEGSTRFGGWSALQKVQDMQKEHKLKIRGFGDVLAEHIQQTINYESFEPALENINNLLNRKDVRESLESIQGKGFVETLQNRIKSIVNPEKIEDMGKVGKALATAKSRIVPAVLLGSPMTWISQPLSLFEASTEIESRFIMQALRARLNLKDTKAVLDAIQSEKYSAMFYLRKHKVGIDKDISAYMGRDTVRDVFGMDRGWKDAYGKPMQKADNIAISQIIIAANLQAQEDLGGKSTDENVLKRTAEIAERIVRRTQPTADAMYRTGLANEKNEFLKLFTYFRSYLDTNQSNTLRQVYKFMYSDQSTMDYIRLGRSAYTLQLQSSILNMARKRGWAYLLSALGAYFFGTKREPDEETAKDMGVSLIQEVLGRTALTGGIGVAVLEKTKNIERSYLEPIDSPLMDSVGAPIEFTGAAIKTIANAGDHGDEKKFRKAILDMVKYGSRSAGRVTGTPIEGPVGNILKMATDRKGRKIKKK